MSMKMGFNVPPENMPWSPEKSLAAMNRLGVKTTVLSLPAGLPLGPVGDENRAAARKFNQYAADISTKYPGRFAFFACVPNLFDTEGAFLWYPQISALLI